jgi:sensor domain CHASE-containing protein
MGPRTAIVYRTSRHVRIALGGLTFAVVALGVGLALVLSLLLSLKAARDREAVDRQAAINQNLCQIVTQFPDGVNATLDRVRSQLHCPPPTTIAQP